MSASSQSTEPAGSPPEPQYAAPEADATDAQPAPSPLPASAPTSPFFPEYIFGLHEAGGEALMIDAERPGWVLELAAIGLDGGGGRRADYRRLAKQGLGVVVRLDHGYAPEGTLPKAAHYAEFAASCAAFVARSRGCHIWIIGNEPNHQIEWPEGEPILPTQYATAYRLCRAAIHAQTGHERDIVLLAGPAPWNARLTYPSNPLGDWVQYFYDVIRELADNECDGFALHTYTHKHDPAMIRADVWQQQIGYQHLRNEFRTYRDFMHAIPFRFRHLPVLITETDPTDPNVGWEPADNLGWIQTAYREIADWNADPDHQPIQALLLYRWPAPEMHGQEQWSIANRPGIIADFQEALAQTDAAPYRVRMPRKLEPVAPEALLPDDERWIGRVNAPAGLRLRLGPGIDHSEIKTLDFETILEVQGESDDWLFVRVGGRDGYVARAWVTWLAPIQPRVAKGELALPPAQQVTVPPDAPAAHHRVAATWNQYGGFILEQSKTLNIDPGVVLAVLMAESQGETFGDDGRMIIRFEPHIFYLMWGRFHPERFADYFSYNPDLPWNEPGQQNWRPSPAAEWRSIHTDQAAEWDAFQVARRLDEAGAMQAVSMGAPQIMGFNHQSIGYASVQEMFYAFQTGARPQFESFFRYMQRHGVVDAVRRRDFEAFAHVYNGSGQESLYAERMRTWLAAYEQVVAAAPAPEPTPAGTVAATPVMPPAAQLPAPQPPGESRPLSEVDPVLYEAWRNHIIEGYANNRTMFDRVLKGFMNPYWTTVVMYGIIFGVGIAAFSVAVILALRSETPSEALGPAALFGGLSVVAFLSFFLRRPLQALEENLQFITWLGIVYNTYWTRLAHAMDQTTFHQEIEDATEDAVNSIQEMLAAHGQASAARPGPE